MRKVLLIASVFMAFLMAFNCENKNSAQMTKAKIVFSGMVAADGCGWLLEVNGEEYSPVNLEKAFEVDGLKVEVTLNYLASGFQCGMNPDFKIPEVKIIEIKHLKD